MISAKSVQQGYCDHTSILIERALTMTALVIFEDLEDGIVQWGRVRCLLSSRLHQHHRQIQIGSIS